MTADAGVSTGGERRATLFVLHFLGGSAREWEPVREALGGAFDIEAIDLAGFGTARDNGAWTVEEMAADLVQRIRDKAPAAWMIVGHSMGAKVAAVVARQAEDGATGLSGLCGLVFLAGSPPEPEPMDEAVRAEMRGWFAGTPDESREQAEGFVRDNIAAKLDREIFETAVQDVLSCKPAAWRAWLDRGSREDWSSYVGRLDTPAVLVAGEQDGPLGEAAQKASAALHFSKARVVTVPGAKHLLPLEAPTRIAELIDEHWRAHGSGTSLVPDDYLALIRSSRTSARTRRILLDRLSDPAEERCLSEAQFAGLEAVIDRIVPQTGSTLPLARLVEASLAKGTGDGWRYANLAGDKEACLLGLQTLDAAAEAEGGASFVTLDGAQQDRLLKRAANGALGGALDPEQMRRWFEDVRAAAVRAYVSHPATLARIGFGGIANGGDGVRKQGFAVLSAGERESWEPVGTGAP